MRKLFKILTEIKKREIILIHSKQETSVLVELSIEKNKGKLTFYNKEESVIYGNESEIIDINNINIIDVYNKYDEDFDAEIPEILIQTKDNEEIQLLYDDMDEVLKELCDLIKNKKMKYQDQDYKKENIPEGFQKYNPKDKGISKGNLELPICVAQGKAHNEYLEKKEETSDDKDTYISITQTGYRDCCLLPTAKEVVLKEITDCNYEDHPTETYLKAAIAECQLNDSEDLVKELNKNLINRLIDYIEYKLDDIELYEDTKAIIELSKFYNEKKEEIKKIKNLI